MRPGGRPPGETGKCKATPSHHELESYSILTCAEDGKDFCEGNFIVYSLSSNRVTFDLRDVNAEYCKPKPKACHCKTMLKNLLDRYPELNKIDGYFTADPFIKGCRCYLGTAARANFKFVQMQSKIEECNEKTEFNDETYGKICDNYKKKNCMGKGGSTGSITKN